MILTKCRHCQSAWRFAKSVNARIAHDQDLNVIQLTQPRLVLYQVNWLHCLRHDKQNVGLVHLISVAMFTALCDGGVQYSFRT
jgi:hypothetical protein